MTVKFIPGPKSILTPWLIADIKAKKAETGWSSYKLGEFFGISHVTIQKALRA